MVNSCLVETLHQAEDLFNHRLAKNNSKIFNNNNNNSNLLELDNLGSTLLLEEC